MAWNTLPKPGLHHMFEAGLFGAEAKRNFL
jgi:hypothetical protein